MSRSLKLVLLALLAILLCALTSVAGPPLPCAYPTRPGVYRVGDWEYEYQVFVPGSKSERRVGILRHRGEVVPGKPDEVKETPLGKFKYHEARYARGWLNTRSYDNPVFPEDGPLAGLLKADDAFARDLYGRLRGTEGNLLVSPYSIQTALAMTWAGARGETADQMARVLHFPRGQASVHPGAAELLARLSAGDPARGPQLFTANALWGRQGEPFEPDFLALVQEKYAGTLRSLDFEGHAEESRQTINRWVEERTAGKIRDLLKPEHIRPSTVLVLTNALYFRGAWRLPFPEKDTREESFHVTPDRSVPVPMMHLRGELRHSRLGDLGQVLELPFQGEDVSMLLLLPAQGADLARMEEQLQRHSLKGWLWTGKKEMVEVFLPRFTMSFEVNLKGTLPAMGMPRAFAPGADFSGMSSKGGLYLGPIPHKTYLAVNEKGAEAAAATAVVVVRGVPTVTFRADRPFLFLIRHNATGTPLFLGRLVNPSSGS